MNDRNKTKAQLLDELAELRREVARLKAVEANCLELAPADNQNTIDQNSLREIDYWFSLSLDMLCIAGTDGYFKKLNPAFEKILGWTTAELQAKPFLDFIHPDDVPATLAEIEKLAQGEPTIYFENRYRCRDGSYKWLAWTAQPTPAGTLYAIARDVTRQKQSEAALERRLRGLDSLNRIGREIAEAPAIPELLEWVAAHIPPATQYPELCKAAIEYNGQLYGAAEVLKLPNQITNALWVGGQSVGRIYLAYTGKYDFLDEESALLGGIASRISAYIENRRLVEQLQQWAAEQEELTSFLDSVIDNIPSPIVVKDAQTLKFVRWNKANEELLGFSREETIGKSDHDFFPKEEADFFNAKDRELLASRRPLDIPEEPIQTATGETRLLHTRKVPILGADGSPKYLLVVSEDITERKQAEQELRQNEALLRTIIDTTPDWIFIKDQGHRYRMVNQGYANSLHMSSEDFIGKNDLELGFPDDIVKGNPEKGIRGFWTDDREVMDSGQSKLIEIEPAVVDGQPIFLRTRKIPLRDVAGNVWGVLGFVQDITAYHLAQEALAKRAAELETVAQVSVAVSTILDTTELLQRVVDLTKVSFNLYHAHVYLLNEPIHPPLEEGGEGGVLVLAAGAGKVGRQMVAQGWSIPLNRERSLVARVARSGQGIIVNDVSQEPDFLPNPLLPQTRAEMAVPMMVGGRLLGILDTQADKIGRFTEEDVRIKTTLAGQIAVALQNAAQYEQTQQALNLTERLFEASRRLTAATDLQEAVAAVVGVAPPSEINRAVLLMFEQNSSGEIEAAIVTANWHNGVGTLPTPVGTRYPWALMDIFKLMLGTEPVFVNDILNDDRVDPVARNIFVQQNIRSMAATPLWVGSHQIGTFLIETEDVHHFTDDEIEPYTALVGQLAIIIENQRLFEQTQGTLKEVEVLYNISTRLNAAVTLNEILEIFASTEVGANVSSVSLSTIEIDQTGQPEWATFVANWAPEGIDPLATPIGTRYYIPDLPIAKLWTSSPDQAVLIGDINNDARVGPFLKDVLQQSNLAAMALIPLNVRDQWIGMVSLSWPTPQTFTERHQRFFNSLAIQMAVAVNNQLLLEQTQAALTEQERLALDFANQQNTLQAVLQSIPAGVFVIEVPTGKTLLSNDQAQDILGRGIAPDATVEELTEVYSAFRYGTDELYPQNELPIVRAMFGAVTMVDDMEIRRPDGKCILLQVFGAPIRDAAGNIIASVAIFQDITERRRIEEELRANQERLSEALAIAQLANWEFDVATQIFTFNDQFYSLFHTTAEQEGGYLMPAMQYAQKFVHPDDVYMVGVEIQKAIEATDPNYFDQLEHRIIRADGSEGHILVRSRVVKDEQGRTVKTVGANQDITEYKQAELERERLLAEIEATYRQFVQREWSQFLGDRHGGRWYIEYHQAGLAAESEPGEANKPNGNGHNDPAISAPIKLRGQTIGNLNLEDSNPNRNWTAEEKALVETISEQLAQTVENLRLFEDTQKQATREQLTREITDKMRSSPDIDSIINTGLSELARVLGVPRTYVKLTAKPEKIDTDIEAIRTQLKSQGF